ncbi:unnamed protein product [Zymoseptoria tritici ST99CH_1A5]|uniref:Uncharacterized protein n=3 Tax=Zymoseptoria tritici TaxID=1047171 RepID=A0A1X7RQZ4_ZYMT9|nr:unnamed protein product [Zymoseptoria tritici ST99CH_3D7]SMR50800.1 unnamed protein product [Zymoseptoria tritici ST99CH_1E4]SMR51740.1 unnamed protein product [Zymoseptoria tritici ST99CH_3D1]SMY23504.1 unnamed protein product [Zymoseptoria tritici ST99CH_1A5]
MVTVFPLFHHNKDSVTTLAAMPTSPLPDTSALEAGIIQDERPSRLSRVQDNVRNLLRTSVFGSVASSPTTPARPVTGRNRPGAFSPIVIPTSPPAQIQPGPLSSVSTPTHYTSSPLEIPPPAATYQTAGQANGSTHYQSTLFNGRAVAALNHPDLSDLSVESLSQQKAHQQQRSGSGSRRSQKQSHRGRRTAKKAACSRVLLCVLAALLLGALVATYISIATTATGITTTFHVLFVLGIILAVILFAHTALRLCIGTRKRRATSRPSFDLVSRSDISGHAFRRHRPGHSHSHPRGNPSSSISRNAIATESGHIESRSCINIPVRVRNTSGRHFIPPAPIQVHTLSSSSDLHENDILPPTHLPTVPAPSNQLADKNILAPPPPPAYGHYRTSVRADPDLLHWAPSPTGSRLDAGIEEERLPSPTYAEAIGEGGWMSRGPPSYRTRESPPRAAGGSEGRVEAVKEEMVEMGRAM